MVSSTLSLTELEKLAREVGGRTLAHAVMEAQRRKPCSRLLLLCVLCLHLRWALTDCPADGRTWVPFKDRCYHFVHGEEDKLKSYTFERAKTLCQGFDLLTIQSAEENDLVINYSPEVWKGNVNVWLGMYYDTNSEDMKWFGDDPVKYTNWEYSSSPSDLVPIDTCVALHSTSGRWENVSCLDEVENGVVCETTQKAADATRKPNALVSALVILSVVTIIGISVVIWFLQQKHHSLGSGILSAFEYHPPFRVLDNDQSCLVEAEETDSVP